MINKDLSQHDYDMLDFFAMRDEAIFDTAVAVEDNHIFYDNDFVVSQDMDMSMYDTSIGWC